MSDTDEELKSAAKLFQVHSLWIIEIEIIFISFISHVISLTGHLVLIWYQTASGIFAHLKSAAAVMGGQEPTPDLNPETLSTLSALMLAQAQEVFVSKAVQDKMKDAITAKLCAQADEMYADTLRLMQKDTVKHLWDREWLPIVSFMEY